MDKLKVYYAHYMGLYNTPQEKRDIQSLELMGFEVVNPNSPGIGDKFKDLLLFRQVMEWPQPFNSHYDWCFDSVFGQMVRHCDILAYRPLPDGRITGGVALEIKEALAQGKQIIEIPNFGALPRRYMTGDETRAYMADTGVR